MVTDEKCLPAAQECVAAICKFAAAVWQMLTGLQQLRIMSKQGLHLYDGGNVFPDWSWFVAGPINKHLH